LQASVLIDAIAKWMKIGICLVLPQLTIATAVETQVTSELLLSMLN
jgi:hypothetical protein